MERAIASCADCTDFENVRDCKKLNNMIGKVFAFVFGSDRPGSIDFIRESGYDEYASSMAETGAMSFKKK